MRQPPLPERCRPTSLSHVLGHQEHLAGDGILAHMLREKQLHSMILWGPPGCGKTTLARVLARELHAPWTELSAVLDGVAALRDALKSACDAPMLGEHTPVLFVDEIHRWNKAQQDALLPHIEHGDIILIGATTENPSIALRPALLSRSVLVALSPLDDDAMTALLKRAMTDAHGLNRADLMASPDIDAILHRIAHTFAGDARRALAALERVVVATPPSTYLQCDQVVASLGTPAPRYGESDRYDIVSAWIKSMRGSDPDAAIYWLARLMASGEDAVYLARRLMVFASEDIGNADPRALAVAVDAARAVERIGMPEGRIPLAQATTWLACAPKSNAAYMAINAAFAEVGRSGALPVPAHLRQVVGPSERQVGVGVGYKLPHDYPDRIVQQAYLPHELQGTTYYKPAQHGEERTIAQRLQWWAQRLKARKD